jgi:phosphoserine aminotransferase
MFSVQHGFGCPPGLGVLLMNRRSIEKAGRIARKHPHLGNFHDLTNYYSRAIKNQTPAPPNMLGIYLLGRICEDMLIMGIDRIRRETVYKAAVLYNTYEKSPLLKPFIEKNEFRSKTVINAETSVPSNEIIARLAEKGIIIGPGYEKYKFKQIRIANYPTHSKEQFELIADLLEDLS